eukprot:gene2450-3026_t
MFLKSCSDGVLESCRIVETGMVDVNSVDDKNRSGLHMAATSVNGFSQVVKLILDHQQQQQLQSSGGGGSSNQENMLMSKDKLGKTPIELCQSRLRRLIASYHQQRLQEMKNNGKQYGTTQENENYLNSLIDARNRISNQIDMNNNTNNSGGGGGGGISDIDNLLNSLSLF